MDTTAYKTYTVAQNDQLLPIDILSVSLDDVFICLRFLELHGVVDILELTEVEWIDDGEFDPQYN